MQGRPQISRRWMSLAGSRTAAFSLLEVLIVLALILILTTLYWRSTSGGHQRAQMVGCQQNLRKIFVALEIYAHNSADKFPLVTNALVAEEALDPLVPRYTADTSIFICPASHNPALPSGEPIAKRKISYAYYMGNATGDAQRPLMSDRQVDTQPKPAGQIVFSSTGEGPGSNHGKSGGNILFCDGHVDQTPPLAPISITLTQGIVLLNPRP